MMQLLSRTKWILSSAKWSFAINYNVRQIQNLLSILQQFWFIFTVALFDVGEAQQGWILITLLSCLASVAAVISRRHEGPGEMGKAVVIPKDEQEKMKELFKINQFNLMASDMIALNRSLPDVRLDGCVSVSLLSKEPLSLVCKS